MHRMASEDGDMLNRCRIMVDGEAIEVSYTHCHDEFIEAGGSTWDDTIYLGQGEITVFGYKAPRSREFPYFPKSFFPK